MRKGGEYALEEGIDKEKSLKKGDTRTVGRNKYTKMIGEEERGNLKKSAS